MRDRLQRPLRADAASTLAVWAVLEQSGGGFALTLSSQRGEQLGRRSLSGVDCGELAQAAVLVIALALEDESQRAEAHPAANAASASAVPAAPAPSPAANEPSSPREPTIPPRPAASDPDRREHLALAAGAMFDAGFLPRPSFGPSVGLAYLRGRYRGELWGFWLPPRETEPSSDGRVAVSLWALRPAGCVRVWGRALALDVCLGFELGRALGRGRSLDASRDRRWFYRGAWAGLRFTAALRRRWGLILEPSLAIPFGRPTFVSEAVGGNGAVNLHTPTVVSARVTLGLEARF